MKILITEVTCCPGKGSEPGAGWNWALALSKYNDVFVITTIKNKDKIEQYFKENGEKFQVIYHSSLKLQKLQKKIPFGRNFYYKYWLKSISQKIQELHAVEKFDLCQHLTYSTFKYYNPLCELEIPFILGPVGGGERTPETLKKTLQLSQRTKEWFRELQLNSAKTDKKIYQMLEKASLILATTEETKVCIPKEFYVKTELMQAIGIAENELLENRDSERYENEFHMIFVGRLEMWKGLNLLLKIAGHLKELNNGVKYIIHIAGSGKDEELFRNKINKNGLQDYFIFYGMLPRPKVMELFKRMDVFLFTGYRDSGSMAVIEAMSQRLPVLCLNTGGQVHNVHDNTGFKVNTNQSIEGITADFVNTIEKIRSLCDTGEINQYVDAAIDNLKNNFIWDCKAQIMTRKYKELLEMKAVSFVK